MPELCRFRGIVLKMHLTDHPPAHFHAHYGSRTARIRLAPVCVMNSDLPPSVLRTVMSWANMHEAELDENWRRLRLDQSPMRIAPLE